MSPQHVAGHRLSHGFPRVSGDEPLKSTLRDGDEEFSPRERG